MARRDAPWARFDDMITGSALLCSDPTDILLAERPADVVPVLADVQRAVDAGRWAFGYVSYEAAAGLGTGLRVHPERVFEMPLVWFAICDRPSPVPVVTAPLHPAPLHPAPVVRVPNGAAGSHHATSAEPASWRAAWTAAEHAARVEAIKEGIARGDTYQCNLTERMLGELNGDPVGLYRDLALGQRGAYNAYLDLGRHVIASASPELFFERRGDDLLLRPMKGTARRGRFPLEDRQRAEQLRGSEKERAENLMIVDLMRNDVSRVAEVGSVAVPALFTIERYETVLQLTSDVTARLRPGVGLVELFTALFPCGSVTGAPKASSMTIIRAVEPTPRGVYCGAIGLLAPAAEPVRARFSVAIRTAVVDTSTGQAVYGTGGGITWSSDPDAEHAELQAKTAVLQTRPVAYQLLETMRAEGGEVCNRELHLDRMAASADHLGFVFDRRLAQQMIDDRLAGARGPVRVRMLLDRPGGIQVEVDPIPAGPDTVLLALDDEPVDPEQWWLYHKTTLRAAYDRRRERRPEADDVIMINTAGELTEVTRATLAVQLDDQWWTPPLTAGCLPGVERGRLIAIGRLAERSLTPADLDNAQGLAVISALRGWRSARLR